MMTNGRQVIFLLALLFLEVFGLGSNSDSDDAINGHLTGRSNGRANTRLNPVRRKSHPSTNERNLIDCPDKIFECLNQQGEPLGESMLRIVAGPTNQLVTAFRWTMCTNVASQKIWKMGLHSVLQN